MERCLTPVQGGSGIEREKTVHLERGNVESSRIDITFRSYSGFSLSWDHTAFQCQSQWPEGQTKLEDFRLIPEAIKKSPKFVGAICQGGLLSVAFSLKSINVNLPDTNMMIESEDSKSLRESLKLLADTQSLPHLVVYFEITATEYPDFDIIEWFRMYKVTHSISLHMYRYSYGVTYAITKSSRTTSLMGSRFQLDKLKGLNETPNATLRRKHQFEAFDDYLVTMLYGMIREREYLERDAHDRRALLGLMTCNPVPSSLISGTELYSKYTVQFYDIDRQRVKRVIETGDLFQVRIGTGVEAATSRLWPCECIADHCGGVSGLLCRPDGDLRPVHHSSFEAASTNMMNSVRIILTGSSKLLEARMKSFSAFQQLIKASGTSLQDPHEVNELERLLLGKSFHTNMGHRLLDGIEPDQKERLVRITDNMDHDQLEALKHIQNARDIFSIITTPCGTGEFDLIVNIVQIFNILSKRVLVVTSKEAFANRLITHLSALIPDANALSFFSLYEEVLGSSDGFWRGKPDLPTSQHTSSIEDDMREKAQDLSLLTKLFDLAKEDVLITTDRELRKIAAEKILRQSDFVVTTCAAGAEDFLHQNFQADIVIITQASYAQEMDVLPILIWSRKTAKLVLLIGDERQMEPVVLSRGCRRKERGSDALRSNPFADQMLHSLMERLRCTGYPSISLTRNIRMVERMALITSRVFYCSTVVDYLPSVALDKPERGLARTMLRLFQDHSKMKVSTPAIILDVRNSVCAQDSKSEGKASRFNLHHVTATWKFLRAILEEDPDLDTEKITIVTPYRSQADRYRKTIKLSNMPEEVRSRLLAVTIRTIDSFQSGENQMVILDAVIAQKRDGGPGFLTDRHRLNVATSCAQDCFILVIDMGILDGLEGDLRYSSDRISGESRLDQDPEYLRALLLQYRNSNSVLDYPIKDDEIFIQGPFLTKSLTLIQRQARVSNRLRCSKCDSVGHRTQHCIRPDQEECHQYGKLGHLQEDCPQASARVIASEKALPLTKMKYTPEAYMIETVTRIV